MENDQKRRYAIESAVIDLMAIRYATMQLADMMIPVSEGIKRVLANKSARTQDWALTHHQATGMFIALKELGLIDETKLANFNPHDHASM